MAFLSLPITPSPLSTWTAAAAEGQQGEFGRVNIRSLNQAAAWQEASDRPTDRIQMDVISHLESLPLQTGCSFSHTKHWALAALSILRLL